MTVDRLDCPLCARLTIRFGEQQRESAINCLADHMAFCLLDLGANPYLTEQLENEANQ